ncbi:MAG: hypothetical protein IKR27_00050 [Lachnospiraceae bacterium]|nr:hypothetical protein [Lachnospiraceae bacterium]
MLNCLKADLIRVQKKKAYIICLSILIVLMIGMTILAASKLIKGEVSDLYRVFMSAIFTFNSLLIGIPIFSAVLTDDFKSRSLQTAIGRGMSRSKLVFTRFFEFVIVLAESYLLISVLVFVYGLIIGVKGSVLTDIINNLWIDSISIIGFFAVSMIFVYMKQTGTVGLVVYIILALNAFELILTGISQISVFKKNDINLVDFTIEGMKESIKDADKSVSARIMWGFALVIFFIVIPLMITRQIFRKKELEF